MFNSLWKFRGFKGERRGKMWQLFRATDFESLMYPCFTFCRILGIFPYKIKASTIKLCKPCYILWAIIICAFCTFEIIELYTFNTYIVGIYKNVPRRLQLNSFSISGGFIVVTTFILNGPRMRFLQTIMELSLKLPLSSYQNLSRLIHAKDIFGFLFLVLQILVYFFMMPLKVVPKLLAVYVILLMFQMDMLYGNCVCVLKACYKQINDNLANLRELVTNGEPYLLSGTYHEQENPFLLIEIIALKKQHLAISGAVQMLKMVFSLQLLSTIVLSFTDITFSLYFYLLRIQVGGPMSSQEIQIYFYNFVVLITWHFLKLVFIVWACETGKNEAMEISSSVYGVLNSTSNEQIRYEMRLFSLQLLHSENIFSAKGLIVDATLLTAMVGSITTYLVILVQFLYMSNSCD